MTDSPVLTLRIPNPFFEGRNDVYVIRGEPVTLIDTGIATQRAFDSLTRDLAQHGLQLRDIGCVILTHKHIDHIGNAWRIQRESGAPILVHEADLHSVEHVDPAGDDFRQLVHERLRQWQAPAVPAGDSAAAKKTLDIRWEIEPATATPMIDGQRIDLGCGELEVIHTPGHTVGSVCLRFDRQLFSGDHILPTISPNIGGGDLRQHGLLNQYLRSLQRIQSIAPDIEKTFPGHGDPFDGLQERCQKLYTHHTQRLLQIKQILASHGPLSVYELARRMYGELQDFHVMLGCAEANAHLEYLVAQGDVCEEQNATDRQVFRLS